MHEKTVLDNGLRVVTTTMPHTYSVAVSYFTGIGSRYETAENSGISHFIEHLLFKGNKRRPTSRDISAAIEGVGGALNGGTDKESTLYWIRVARPDFNLALEVLTDMYIDSLFESHEIERERGVIIEEILMTKDVPSQQVHMLIDEILWPDHPLGRDIAGTRETVSGIDRTMMLDYLKSNYIPANTVISIAGNIEHAEAVETVQQMTSGWQGSESSPQYEPWMGGSNPRILVEHRDTEQAHLCLAMPGLPLLHTDRFALDILNIILGEGMSSRLFTEIRDKLGLTYSIHSYSDHLLDTGAITISAGVEPENLPVTVEAIMKELTLIREPVSEEEFIRARALAKGRLQLRMEDTRSVAGWMGGQEVLTGNIMTVEQVLEKIDLITIEQMQKIACDLIKSEDLRLAVVGPVEDETKLESLLKL
ncbi:MAG: insulinase family protein [Dehalococcoidales bacterium]|nr:insulinase family protein [Dehalococcoidales bacterium]